MPLINRVFFLFIVLASIQFSACGSEHNTKSGSEQRDGTTQTAEIGKNDLLDLIQGRWFDENDPAVALEIRSDTIRHLYNDKVTEEAVLEINSDCSVQACQKPLAKQGWCFVASGKERAACYLVLKCDGSTFQFVELGEEKSEQIYRRP